MCLYSYKCWFWFGWPLSTTEPREKGEISPREFRDRFNRTYPRMPWSGGISKPIGLGPGPTMLINKRGVNPRVSNLLFFHNPPINQSTGRLRSASTTSGAVPVASWRSPLHRQDAQGASALHPRRRQHRRRRHVYTNLQHRHGHHYCWYKTKSNLFRIS